MKRRRSARPSWHRLPGSGQIGRGKAFLERYPWQRFEPHAEWASWAGSEGHLPAEVPYTAGIPGGVRITYAPLPRAITVDRLDPGGGYSVLYFDPTEGTTLKGQPLRADASGKARVEPPNAPGGDWVLVVDPEPAGPR
ncbi:hypothetical protein [Aquisphaera giovannonii]|uniref:hypothetical protein n=1 Tax=Aquisphaera giovannonii TaxID=406548 RepID=UPI001AEF60E3|nr:hypothetical protein [Aquisphaera giovannonii]